MKVLVTILLACLSGLFYRFGGMGKPFRSWMRDWVCPAFSLGILFLWFKPTAWWGYCLAIPSYMLMGGALSTYWDWLTKLWRGDETEYWENWFLHGFFVGIAFFPFIWVGMHWWAVLLSGLVSGGLMTLISELSGNVWVEELSRGFIAAIVRLFR